MSTAVFAVVPPALVPTHDAGPRDLAVRPDTRYPLLPASYFGEKPLRDDRSFGPPLITPANSSRGLSPCWDRVLSRDSRTSFPMGRPLSRAMRRSRSRRGVGSRTLSVLLI